MEKISCEHANSNEQPNPPTNDVHQNGPTEIVVGPRSWSVKSIIIVTLFTAAATALAINVGGKISKIKKPAPPPTYSDKELYTDTQNEASLKVRGIAMDSLLQESFRISLADAQKAASHYETAKIKGTAEELGLFDKANIPFYKIEEEAGRNIPVTPSSGRPYTHSAIPSTLHYSVQPIDTTATQSLLDKTKIKAIKPVGFKLTIEATYMPSAVPFLPTIKPSKSKIDEYSGDKNSDEYKRMRSEDIFDSQTVHNTIIFSGPNGTEKVVFDMNGGVVAKRPNAQNLIEGRSAKP